MQNIMRNCNSAQVSPGKGISQPALRRCWKADAPSWASGSFHGAPAFLSTQGSPPALAVALFVLLPVLGKALRGMVSREGGLSWALLSTGFSGFSCNPLPKFPPSPSLRQRTLVCLLGYHHEKKGFRL